MATEELRCAAETVFKSSVAHLLHGTQQLDRHLGSHHRLSQRRRITGSRITRAGRCAAAPHRSSQAVDCTQAALQASNTKVDKAVSTAGSEKRSNQPGSSRIGQGCVNGWLKGCNLLARPLLCTVNQLLTAPRRHKAHDTATQCTTHSTLQIAAAHLHRRSDLLEGRPALALAAANLLQAQRVVLRRRRAPRPQLAGLRQRRGEAAEQG